jgi:hypothetical protein
MISLSAFILCASCKERIIIFSNSVRTAKKTQLFTITKINWLTLFKEIIPVYSENRTKPINTNEKLHKPAKIFFFLLFQVEKAILTNFSTLNSNQLPVSPYHVRIFHKSQHKFILKSFIYMIKNTSVYAEKMYVCMYEESHTI